jgi:hypothetical protein
MRPATWFEMSPNELVAAIGAEMEQEPFDHVAEQFRLNHVVMKGKSPVAASWLLKGIPRRKK